jgi:hypothetical protein
MVKNSRRKVADMQRRRTAERGLVRVEVQATGSDAALIRALAQSLRSDPQKAKATRSALTRALIESEVATAFDVFGSDLPDETFVGVFDRPRPQDWRKVDL